MKKVSVILLPAVFCLIFLCCPSAVLSNALEYCGYHNIYINMEQVPAGWSEWGYNNQAMWLYNQYMDIFRYHDSDGSWGHNGDNEFGGYPSDADLYHDWGFHWGPNDLAMTCFSWNCQCCRINESDVVFNPAWSWTQDRNYAEDNPSSVILYQTNLLHELGHTWGMQTRNEDYSYWEPTVMHGYNAGVVQDFMNIHVPEAWAIRDDYKNQESIPALVNMAVHSKYADGSHLNWTNSYTNKTSYTAGESITISRLTVENTGTVDLSNVHLRLYLSPDRSIDTSDTQIGDWYWDPFGHEGYTVADFTTTIPSGLADGSYYVGALITYDGYTEDAFWEDNSTHLWTRINVNSPDLIVQGMTTDPATPFPGENVTVTVTVRNQGSAAAGGFYVDIYKNRGTAPTTGVFGDTWCNITAGLAAGATTTCVQTVTYDSAGTYNMWAQIDSENGVAESNENNNVLGPQGLTVVNPPDLIVQSISTNPATPFPSESVTVTVTIKNQGTGAASNAFWVEFYKDRATAPGAYQSGDGYCNISGLAAGATTTCVKTVSYTPAGTYKMWAQVDSWLNVRESNESNNVFGPQTLTVVNPPDLIVQSISTNPASPVTGQSVSVTVTVKNQGTGAASNAFWVEFYKDRATAPSTYQSGDAYCYISSLAAGATTTCVRSVSYTPAGTYKMWAQVDSWCYVRESNEGNNVFGYQNIIVTTPGVLSVTPAGGLTSSGNQGGPFSPSSKDYTLQNTGGSPLNWTASKGESWVALSSTGGTLGAGASTTVTVSINTNANGLTPGPYSDTVSFGNTTNGNGNTTRPVSLTVTSAGTLQFTSSAYSVMENGGSILVTVTRTGGSNGAVGVSYATSNGTATAGLDYTSTSGTLSWADGDTSSKTFSIPIAHDILDEGNETLNLTLSSPTGGAALGSPSTAVLTIVDALWDTTFYVSKDVSCGYNSPCFQYIHDGIASASVPSLIKITQETYNEDVALNVNQIIVLDGGCDMTFRSDSSYTTIIGGIKITNGKMILKNIILR